jgi:hypothetical protein
MLPSAGLSADGRKTAWLTGPVKIGSFATERPVDRYATSVVLPRRCGGSLGRKARSGSLERILDERRNRVTLVSILPQLRTWNLWVLVVVADGLIGILQVIFARHRLGIVSPDFQTMVLFLPILVTAVFLLGVVNALAWLPGTRWMTRGLSLMLTLVISALAPFLVLYLSITLLLAALAMTFWHRDRQMVRLALPSQVMLILPLCMVLVSSTLFIFHGATP